MVHGRHEGGGSYDHGSPMEFLKAHPPGPPSYIAHDMWPVPEDELTGWPLLMLLHIFTFSVAFFVLLPASISLRSVKHRWHAPIWATFHVLTSVGLFSATLYNKLTPDFYTGSKHGRMGYAVAGIVASLWLMDCLSFIRGLLQTLARHPPKRWSLVEITRRMFSSREQGEDRAEYTNLVQREEVEEDITLEAYTAATPEHQLLQQESTQAHASRSPPPPVSIITSESRPRSHSRSVSFSVSDELESGRVEQWRQHGSVYSSPTSNNSDLTLHDSGATPTTPKEPQVFPLPDAPISWRRRLRQTPRMLFHTVEHALVPLALATSLDGLVTYTGICRANEINVCMAHLVKGSIFYCYGLLSFARYLGAWKNLGWAWNRATTRNAPSAEMVECLVIFLYGATNTWMERFGSKTGDPYSTRQIQHISIAVMFWFAGAIGMTLESRAVRSWLSGTSAHDVPQDAPSFNPIPGLVIAVTGLAMSAHRQETQFLVDIHFLWGTLLALFAAMRWITYLLLWVKSKTGRAIATSEPSRPPSEVLASFCLSCGGIAFILSMEPIGVEAIRAGHDDVMVFMTFAVSLTCFSFLWMVMVMAFNGFVKTRAAADTVIRHPLSTHRGSQSL